MKRNLNKNFSRRNIDGYVLIYVFLFLNTIDTIDSLTSTSCNTHEDLQCAIHHLICPEDTRVAINDATYGYKIECNSSDAITNCSSATITQCCMESVTDCGSLTSFEVLEELRATCFNKSRCDVRGLGIQRSCSRVGVVNLNYNSYSKIDYSCETGAPPVGPLVIDSHHYEPQTSMHNSDTNEARPSRSVSFLSPTPTEIPVLSSSQLETTSTVWTAESSPVQIYSPTWTHIDADILSSSSFQLTSSWSSPADTPSSFLAHISLVTSPTLSIERTQSLLTTDYQMDIQTSERCSVHTPIPVDKSPITSSSIYIAGVNSIQVERTLQTTLRDNLTHTLNETMHNSTEYLHSLNTTWEFPKSSQVDFWNPAIDVISSSSSELSEYLTQPITLMYSSTVTTVDLGQEPSDNSSSKESDDTDLWTIIGIVTAVCLIPSLVVLLILLYRKGVKYMVNKTTPNQLTREDQVGKITDGTKKEQGYSVDVRNSTRLLATKTTYNPLYVGSTRNPDDDNINVYDNIDDHYNTYIHMMHE